MSYTPTTWETGDTITAEKLNNIEGGIVNSCLIVNDVSGTLDKTFSQISSAQCAFIKKVDSSSISLGVVLNFDVGEDSYSLSAGFQTAGGQLSFSDYVATTENGYPQLV